MPNSMPLPRLPFFPFGLPGRARRALLCLLIAGLGGQGVGQAIERIAAPSHRHLPGRDAGAQALPLTIAPTPDAAHPPSGRDDHRKIPWIGSGPSAGVDAPHTAAPNLDADADAAAAAHAHLGIGAHRHALDDAGVVYVDADEDASGPTSPAPAAAGCPFPAAPPRIGCAGGEGHAAWLAAAGWHALAVIDAPLERPPR